MAAERRAGDLGATLRAARERCGVSLRQIANDTKISVRVLEALERNDFRRLPGGIFSRAFVRSFAAEVGLDPEEAVEDFVRQCSNDAAASGQSTSRTDDFDSFESAQRVASTALWLILLSVVIIAFVLYLNLGRRQTKVTAQPAASQHPSHTKSLDPR